MPNIEASQRDVPLFEVVEHIVGDLGQVVLQFEDLDPTASGLLQAAEGDVGYEHVRARFGNCEALLPVDGAIVQAWDRALADLIKAARLGGLKVSGRASKGEDLKELRAGDFPTRAHNPFANALDLEVEYGGERSNSMVELEVLKAAQMVVSECCDRENERSERLPSDLSTPDRLKEALRILCVVNGNVLGQKICEAIVRESYPQDFDRKTFRAGFSSAFSYLKQGRGSRKYLGI
jgi:hypothetical protein